MTDSAPQFEVKDDSGGINQYSGFVGTSPINIPSVSGVQMTDAMVIHPPSVSGFENDLKLYVSFNNGSNWITLACGGHVSAHCPGDFQQLQIKGSSASGVAYEILTNTDTE